MPDQEFFRLVLPHGELSDDQWRQLITRRQMSVCHWLDRLAFQRLGRAALFSRGEKEYCIDGLAGQESPKFVGAEGYSGATQGIFRQLQKLSPGELERLPSLMLELRPRNLLGFTRDGKWIVAEAKLCWRDRALGLESVLVEETEVARVVEEYSVDYRRIWEFLGNSLIEVCRRKEEELRHLRECAANVEGEQKYVQALYGRVALWW